MGTTLEDMQYEEHEADLALQELIEKEMKKRLTETGTPSFRPKDIDEELIKLSAMDDHNDRESDRLLKEDWSKKILIGLFGYGLLNYTLVLMYGLRLLQFTDTNVIKIFLGGNVAAIPTIAIYITKSLFPTKNKDNK